MSSEKRTYRLKARAEQQAETRQRIIEATAALHDEVGPARTSVAEIARRAGVQRLTVYNNFPDESLLFEACGQHWLAQHPPPDPTASLSLGDPAERLRAVLRAFYGWYRETGATQEHMHRDRLVMPVFDRVMRSKMDQGMADLIDALAAAFTRKAAAEVTRAAIALSVDFWTWRRLSAEGLEDAAAADLMVGAVESASRTVSRAKRS